MKKYLLILILSAVIIPQVTFATWWNPFSWAIFHKTDTKAQILEKRVAELEQKLSNIATSTATTTQIQSPIKKQDNQIQEKPKSVVSTPVTAKPAPSSSDTTPKTNAQPIYSAPVQDFKTQALTILNTAKDNWVELQNYADECASLMAKQKSNAQFLVTDLAPLLSSSAFDATLYKLFTGMTNILNETIGISEKYRIYCSDSANIIKGKMAQINELITAMAAVQNSNIPVTSQKLAEYQTTYFGSNIFDTNRTYIKQAIDYGSNNYTQTLRLTKEGYDAAGVYIARVTTPSTQSAPQYIIPQTPTLPQMPQTTRCTISGDGVGLQAYVNCTTSSF